MAHLNSLPQVSINEAQSYAAVLEGVEKISNLVVRYEIYERLYLRVHRETTDALEERLTRFYVLILSFLAKAKRFYTKSSASKCSIDDNGECSTRMYLSGNRLLFGNADIGARAGY